MNTSIGTHPALTRDAAGRLQFDLIFGSERRTTGSYYTPPELVGELIRSALEPVIERRLAAAKKDGSAAEKALLSIRVCDPACGSGHFLLAAARCIAKELARVRTGEEEPAPERAREAGRDVIAHCIYGVDRNPLDGPEILDSVDQIEKLDKVARRTFGLDEIKPSGIQINVLSGNFKDGPVFDIEPPTKGYVK
jgi:hypothetical protein